MAPRDEKQQQQHTHSKDALADPAMELLPTACTPDSPRPWASRNQPLTSSDLEEEGPVEQGRKKRLILACVCILGNELCERLAFYGLSTNLGLYLKKVMGYPADQASQLLQVWKATVYITPLLGAYLADALMGRFWVILVFSFFYFVGMLGITMTNLIPAIRPDQHGGGHVPMEATRNVFWASMYFTALGSGGIKPCVSSFGGDQFREGSARERSWRSSFFNYFYFTINIGALLASTVVVGVQEAHGYGVGFGIPTGAFMAAITMFILGAAANLYVRVPPEGSPFKRIWRVLSAAVRKRALPLPADACELYEPQCGADDGHGVPFKMAHTQRMRFLDKAAIRSAAAGAGEAVPTTSSSSSCSSSESSSGSTCSPRANSSSKVGCLGTLATSGRSGGRKQQQQHKQQHGGGSSRAVPLVSVSEVEETKAFMAILPLFLCICIYQMASDPISTLLPYTGDAMDRRLNAHTSVPASSVSFTNTFGVLGMVVLYDLAIAPLAARLLGRPISMTMRIGLGFVIQIIALVSAGLIELARYRASAGVRAAFEAAGPGADPLEPRFTQPMSIWWQTVPYFLSGASEVFTNIGCMELFYTNVSEGMRSLGTSVYLLSISVGMYLAGGLNMAVAAASPADPWLANNTLYGKYDMYFFLNAGILLVGTAAYVVIARSYTHKPLPPKPGSGGKGGASASRPAAGDSMESMALDDFKAA